LFPLLRVAALAAFMASPDYRRERN